MVDDLSQADPGTVVSSLLAAWRARDKAGVLRYFADDAVYGMGLPTDVVPYGGETSGKASISDRMQMLLDLFETIDFGGQIMGVSGREVHCRATYIYRHKITGEEIEGVIRIVAKVVDGLVVELWESHDVEKVRAFMRLVAYSAGGDGC